MILSSKKNAVLLCAKQGRTLAGVTERLGIPNELLCRWRRELATQNEIVFPVRGKKVLIEKQPEIIELRKRLQCTGG